MGCLDLITRTRGDPPQALKPRGDTTRGDSGTCEHFYYKYLVVKLGVPNIGNVW